MPRIPHPSAPVTNDTHRVTVFEVFFDLVFVFAFTRITSFMADDLTPLALLRGLLLMLLMWWAWSAYSWLGNQVRADVGFPLVGGIAAMAAIFVVGLLIPDAWHHTPGALNRPLTLACAYSIVRVLFLSTYLYAASGDRPLRRQVLATNIPTVIASVPFIVGAIIGGLTQVVLWTVAFVVDFGGGALLSAHGGWRVRSPGYFAERHGLVVIIALGESIASVGVGLGAVPVSVRIVTSALLGLALIVCLWFLYFRAVAPAAQRRLVELTGDARPAGQGRLHRPPLHADRRRALCGRGGREGVHSGVQ